jgi:hypothetical protein
MIRSAPDPVGERDKLGEEKSAAVGSAERCSYQPLWTPSAAMVRSPQLICVAEAAAAAPCGPVAESSLGQAFPAAGQHLEPDTAGGEVVHGVDQLEQIPAEPVQIHTTSRSPSLSAFRQEASPGRSLRPDAWSS